MSSVDTNTLQWVKSEIDDTLKQAQTSLEAYVEDTADESQIQFCINYLHQVHGTLQMVELHGAALAIEEMEKLSQAIFDDTVNNKDDAFETLMHGIIQVPDYLEHLLEGNPDMPVVLLPLLNDIRAARNEPLLSEGALFMPDLSVAAPAATKSEGSDLAAVARKLRHNFHLGLLSWFKNKNAKAGLQKIADVITELMQSSKSEEARRVFWIAGGLVESLKDDGVDTSVAVKMLMGHVDRQIKKIIDNGDTALDNEPPEELEKNLLYYVASSTTSGNSTQDIKDSFNLSEIMPNTQAVEQARADMSAPNAALMATVSSVIIEDINKVKDNLDMYVRADDKDISVLEEVNSALTQMADTLAMLNLGRQRKAVLKQAETIGNMVSGQLSVNDSELMNVAAAMIIVENSLADPSTAKSASFEDDDNSEAALEGLQQSEQKKLMQNVLEEAKVNLSKVKDALTEFNQNNEQRDQLKLIPNLLEQMHGSLAILQLNDAANLLDLTNKYIQSNLIQEKIAPASDDMNNLADTISSLEYYMESLMGSWGQPEAILDIAEQSLQALGINTKLAVEAGDVEEIETASEDTNEVEIEALAEQILEAEDAADAQKDDSLLSVDLDALELDFSSDDENTIENSLELSTDDLSLDDISLDLADSELADNDLLNSESAGEFNLDEISLDEGLDFEVDNKSADEEALDSLSLNTNDAITAPPAIDIEAVNSPTDQTSKKKPSLLDDTIDDEIIEIFMEEAEEAYKTISELLPMWAANTTNDDPLKEIRRAYHTLKGSGRLVGAVDLGEFAWAFENMLNRVLDNTIKVGPEVLDLMDRGKQALPALFEQFKVNGKVDEEFLTLMSFADTLSQGESIRLDDSVSADVEIVNIDDAAKAVFEVEEVIDIEASVEEQFPVDIDPVLLDIYRKEVAIHVETLKQYINSWDNGKIEPEQSLLRALHTITGSSRTTGVEKLAIVCSRFEHYVKHLQDNEYTFPHVAINELTETILLIERSVACLDKRGAILPDCSELLLRIDSLPKEFNISVDEDNIIADEAIVEVQIADYDEELLEIFLEEAVEILDESDQVIHDWINDPKENKYVEELQRHLHTLKGGARMAGVTELGDLGHSMESLLTAVVNGHMKPSKPMLDLVQRSQDRLVKMLEHIQANEGLTSATDLLDEVDVMLKNRGKVDDLVMLDTATNDAELIVDDISEVELDEPLEPVAVEIVVDNTDLDNSKVVIDKTLVPNLTTIDIPDLDVVEKVQAEDFPLETELEIVETNSTNIIPLEIQELVVEKNEDITPVSDEEHDRRKSGRVQSEQIRVRADLLDNLVNFAGEVSIYRSRLEQQTNNFRYNIVEFDDTVNRLREQLRQFEIETEAQIEYKTEDSLSTAQADFDPLEMDRFTTMQHLSRAMMESLGDLDSLRGILNNLTRESETLLLQQSRVNTDLQEGLMRTRMVPFSGQAARLRRIVRQTCSELGKHAELHLEGVDTELDRTVLERIISPVEHMLRNAVAHGIEKPEDRKKIGKPETGNIYFTIINEGSDILIKIRDDGGGINLEAIRSKAISKGMIKAEDAVSKRELLEMIMQPGFSTAETVSQISGRGVGMDVVNTEIKQLGGVFKIDTELNKGSTFTVTLPLTLAISRALMVMVGDDTYAVPLLSVKGVERINTSQIKEILDSDNPVYNWVGEDYAFMHLGTVMGVRELVLTDETKHLPLLMVRSGEFRAAILVDDLLGSREIVVKSVGPQLSTLRGISGATVMGDGSVVLIIDLAMLIRLSDIPGDEDTVTPIPVIPDKEGDTATLVMVVDDSITVRKVTTRLLERHEMRVIAAKDGVDALAQLQETVPDIMLLDVEMPRMDGFELASNMRNDDRLKNIPIIMITSRTGQKHRDRAASIGVNIYMGKPFTEADLMDNINVLIGED